MIRLGGGQLSLMDQARGAAPAIRRAGSVALITGLMAVAGLGLAGCTSSSPSPGAGSSPGTSSSPGTASASPGLSVRGAIAADARVGKTTVSARQSASSGHAITATTDVGAIVVAPTP